jgi:hypothetical protein
MNNAFQNNYGACKNEFCIRAIQISSDICRFCLAVAVRRRCAVLIIVNASYGNGESERYHHASDQHRRLGQDNANLPTPDDRIDLSQFSISNFTVLGPTSFPKPSWKAGENAVAHLKPTYGQHRSDSDAIFVLSAEYGINTYLSFVYSLRDTGYEGDVVFGISSIDLRNRQIKQFLSETPNLITYALDLRCFNAENELVESAKGGMRVCQVDGLYGTDSDNATGAGEADPRPPRTIATTRYELYWLWSLHYSKHSWIMLLDARDAFFQTDPFQRVPRCHEPDHPTGILHFFGVSVCCEERPTRKVQKSHQAYLNIALFLARRWSTLFSHRKI